MLNELDLKMLEDILDADMKDVPLINKGCPSGC